jgi:hypothetical protein
MNLFMNLFMKLFFICFLIDNYILIVISRSNKTPRVVWKLVGNHVLHGVKVVPKDTLTAKSHDTLISTVD